jgi:hypothetical protein
MIAWLSNEIPVFTNLAFTFRCMVFSPPSCFLMLSSSASATSYISALVCIKAAGVETPSASIRTSGAENYPQLAPASVSRSCRRYETACGRFDRRCELLRSLPSPSPNRSTSTVRTVAIVLATGKVFHERLFVARHRPTLFSVFLEARTHSDAVMLTFPFIIAGHTNTPNCIATPVWQYSCA